MKKFTLFFMSMICMLTTAMAKDDAQDFNSPEVYPSSDKLETCVYNIRMRFAKEVKVKFPETGFPVVNTTTKDTIMVSNGLVDEWDPYSVVFYFEQKLVEGKEGEEYQDQYITAPGTYTYTIPAGVIKSIEGDEFPQTTYTFTVVSTFAVKDYTPKEASVLDTIVVTFDTEIAAVKLPASGMYLLDSYWSPVAKVDTAIIATDKKSVALVLESAVTAAGNYNLDVYQGVFESSDGVNEYCSLSFKVVSTNPGFETNYKNGDRVQELGNVFEITISNAKEIKLVTDTLYAYLPGGGEAAGVAKLAGNKITVTFAQAFTEQGDYLFYIPAGMFTMDGVENEMREINVTLFTFTITPLEVVSITPKVGDVDALAKVVITFNQNISLSYNEDWQQISREVKLTCGGKEYVMTYAPETWNVTNELVYLVNAEWNGFEYTATPITAAGTYTLNMADIVVDYAGEEGIDEWGYPSVTWHAKNHACSGTYSWTIGNGGNGINVVGTEIGKELIYDLLGRRVEKITSAGIYIVNGKKTYIK